MRFVMLFVIAGVLIGSSVFADFTSWDADHRSRENANPGNVYGDTPRAEAHSHLRFEEHDRQAVRHYYWEEHQSGTCPPGLVHMQSGCMSLNRDRKWSIGTPLPLDALAYEVSTDVVIGLPLLFPDTRYVRVDTAILLVRSSSALVLDAADAATDL